MSTAPDTGRESGGVHWSEMATAMASPLAAELTWCCTQLADHLVAGDSPIVYRARFREVGVLVVDGGTSAVGIGFCPFCGATLPGSLRDEWYDAVEALGFDPDDADLGERLPPELLSHDWWRTA